MGSRGGSNASRWSGLAVVVPMDARLPAMEWLDQLVSRSDHAALEPPVRDRLFEAIGAAIDDQGGSFVMNFETVLITATRLG